MPKLNQIIAIVGGKKSRVQSAITEVYHALQKGDRLSGLSRTYRPKDEEGEPLPPESKHVQIRVREQLQRVRDELTDLFDGVATLENANTQASADVVVDDKTLLSGVPVTTLLFLEKQLTDLHTLVSKLPTLDPSDQWHWSDEANCFATAPYETVKTKKVPRHYVKQEVTQYHPAQVEMYHEDVTVGNWTNVKLSGAVPETERNELLGRVRKLQDAVKCAREEANTREVVNMEIGKPIFDYLLGK